MSLAFALMAAINGSTGSWATLSHGLELPHQASPARPGAPRILIDHGWRRKGRPGHCCVKPRGSHCHRDGGMRRAGTGLIRRRCPSWRPTSACLTSVIPPTK